MPKLIVLRDSVTEATAAPDSECLGFQEFIAKALSRELVALLFKYDTATLFTYRLAVLNRPFITALLLRVVSRGQCYVQDEEGRRARVTVAYLTKLLSQVLTDAIGKRKLLRNKQKDIDQLLLPYESLKVKTKCRNSLRGQPVYLRTELAFGVRSGGSIGHIAGVLNCLSEFIDTPIFITTDVVPGVRPTIETHVVFPESRFVDFGELRTLHFHDTLESKAKFIIGSRTPAFLYQRYSLNNYTGLSLARLYNVPFVLEYNGSEIWISRHWGRPLKYEDIAEKIECLNFTAADVIVVVSRVMEEELVNRGVAPEKILVNPNGVDPGLYSPDVDGMLVRKLYRLENKTVIGFIGTFGQWHGAEVLAESFGRLLKDRPAYREHIRLLMVGDGQMMSKVKDVISRYDIQQYCVLPGLIPQEQGPSHLAACDVLVSPHVPNPDGSPFFGSPTKLFEYMAMAKGIVASDLDQIGEVLRHDVTAWLVKPGDAESLKDGLLSLLQDDEARLRLGQAARKEVLARYTWQQHTQRIIEKLKERCG